MIDLHEIQRHILARAAKRPVGSSSRFALMHAAAALGNARDAEDREEAVQAKETAA